MRRGIDVVVATPGRALDHIRRGTLVLASVQTLVLDEADEMLDMGFAEDLEAILEAVPRERQTALFSATIPRRIATLAQKHLRDPERVAIEEDKPARGAAPRVRQVAYVVPRPQKLAALGRILDMEAPAATLVFCRTRNEVDELAQSLAGRGYGAEALHGGLAQVQRDRVMKRFREGAVEMVLATDVAARGLDIGHLSHVVNYDVPASPDAYVHRIGRTGRAGREGVAITLAEPREQRLLRAIERATGRRLEIATVPTVADLRARRLELTRASLREALLEGGLDPFRTVVETLGDEFDVLDIAAAAVKLADQADRGEPEGTAATEPARDGDMVRVYISAGRRAGVGPNDLVGAITGEARLEGGAIGAIEIADGYSLVEIPESLAPRVVRAMKGIRLRGRPVTASLYRDKRTGRGSSDPRPRHSR
jgi:ATP-dependent RNA helicase DeaD